MKEVLETIIKNLVDNQESIKIEEAEDAIYNNDVSDITDIMIEMVNGLKGTNNQ